MERTYKFSQKQLADNVDLATADKVSFLMWMSLSNFEYLSLNIIIRCQTYFIND